MKQYVIYTITNALDGKIYVGSSNGSALRWKAHRQRLRKGSHHSRHLQFAFTRDGEAAFVFLVVEIVEDPIFLFAREQFWFWRTRSCEMEFGYNTSLRPDGPFGYRHTPEAIEKIRAAGTGRKNPGRVLSEETKAKIGIAHTGKKRREGTGAKISAALKGRKVDPEVIAKIVATKTTNGTLRSSHRKGAKHSLESVAKISASKKGVKTGPRSRPRTEEHKAALSASLKGRVISESHKRKIVEANDRRWAAHRAALSGRKDTIP